MNIREIESDLAKQFFHSVTLRADSKIIRNNGVFAVATLGEKNYYCIITFLLCPNNEYKCLAVCIIRISSTCKRGLARGTELSERLRLSGLFQKPGQSGRARPYRLPG